MVTRSQASSVRIALHYPTPTTGIHPPDTRNGSYQMALIGDDTFEHFAQLSPRSRLVLNETIPGSTWTTTITITRHDNDTLQSLLVQWRQSLSMQYRAVYYRYGEWHDMIGANYRLTISRAITLMPSDGDDDHAAAPMVHDIYPWFFTRNGSFHLVSNLTSVSSSSSSSSAHTKRSLWVYTPPSYHENPYTRYDIMIVPDGLNVVPLSYVLDHMIVNDARVMEMIVVGINHDGPGSLDQLDTQLPWSGVQGYECANKNASLSTLCDNCLWCMRHTAHCSDAIKRAQFVNCTISHWVGGNATSFADWIIGDLLPMVIHRYRGYPSRDHIGIMGHGAAGLFALHTLWTRPLNISIAACLSPWLYWPRNRYDDSLFSMIHDTIAADITRTSNPAIRPATRLYMDTVALMDDHDILIGIHNITRLLTDPLAPYRGYYRMDESLWLQVIPADAILSPEAIYRYWLPLSILYRPDGDATLTLSVLPPVPPSRSDHTLLWATIGCGTLAVLLCATMIASACRRHARERKQQVMNEWMAADKLLRENSTSSIAVAPQPLSYSRSFSSVK